MGVAKRIVVPTDFSSFSAAAALRAASLCADDGRVHLVHSVRFPLVAAPYEISMPAAAWEGVREGAEQRLEQERSALEKRGVTVTSETSTSGDPVSAITTAVENEGADLVVMGTHGSGGLRHAFLGSTTERALRSMHVPLLAVGDDLEIAEARIESILVATDFSEGAENAIEVARSFATKLGAKVEVVHAVDIVPDYLRDSANFALGLEEKVEQESFRRLAAVAAELEEAGVAVNTTCRRGSPSEVIADLARERGVQLIIMGTRGQTGLRHLLLGSVAERTLRAAECAVLAVPPPAQAKAQ